MPACCKNQWIVGNMPSVLRGTEWERFCDCVRCFFECPCFFRGLITAGDGTGGVAFCEWSGPSAGGAGSDVTGIGCDRLTSGFVDASSVAGGNTAPGVFGSAESYPLL